MSEAENDQGQKFVSPHDLAEAICLLSRLPVPVILDNPRHARAAWAYPIVGILIGGLAALIATIALWLNLPASLAAGLALFAGIISTGALHEDGFADCADGFWGGQTRAARLDIMHDSRIGTYGVLALAFSVLLRWGALSLLFAAGWVWIPLLIAGVASRAAMVVLMGIVPFARRDGLGHTTGQPQVETVLMAVTIGLASVLLLVGSWTLPLILMLALVPLTTRALALSKIGGQTGDVLGATQQLSEITLSLTLCALIS